MKSFVHLATTNVGGAGIAAERIHNSLLQSGSRSRMIVQHGVARNEVQIVAGPRSRALSWAAKALFRVGSREKYYFRDQSWANPDLELVIEAAVAASPDAILSHFVTSFLSFPDLAKLHQRTGAPLIWFLMDMASLTGGCHYAWDCTGYQTGCGNCPALYLSGPRDHSRRTLANKFSALDLIPGAVVAGSTPLADQARASRLFAGRRIEVIPLAVPPDRFRPRDQGELRRELSIDPVRPVLFFGARQQPDPRKGMAVLYDALGRLSRSLNRASLPTLLIAGNGSRFNDLAQLGFPVRQLGFLRSDDLARAYAAATVFVSPSVEDSGPMMVNEAAMCGTPVIAFAIGVAMDLVKPGRTGLVVGSIGNPGSLAAAILEILNWPAEKLESARSQSRKFALDTFSPSAQTRRLCELADALRMTPTPATT